MTVLKDFQEEQDKEFDENFACGEDQSEIGVMVDKEDFIPCGESVKLYIHRRDEALEKLVRSDERKRIGEEVEKKKLPYDHSRKQDCQACKYREEYNQALDDIKNLLL